jgi:hypothetical protein
MPIFTVIDYNANTNTFRLKNNDTGRLIVADLFLSNTFKDYPNGVYVAQLEEVGNSMIGKKVEIEELAPYEYIAKNIKLI